MKILKHDDDLTQVKSSQFFRKLRIDKYFAMKGLAFDVLRKYMKAIILLIGTDYFD